MFSTANLEEFADKLYLPGSSKRPARFWPPGTDFRTFEAEANVMVAPFGTFVKRFCEAAKGLQRDTNALSTAELTPILKSTRDLFNEAIEFFSTSNQVGAEAILRAATKNYVFVGLLMSAAGEREGEAEDRIGDVFHSIKKCFTTMNKKEEGKRIILIFLFAECFKLMFKLKRLGMFPSILTSYQMFGGEKLLPRARKADCVQFLFYRALYEFHSQKIDGAYERFVSAWLMLHEQDFVHKRRVAGYLIALALVRGRAASEAFLHAYGLTEAFGPLCRAVQSGNLAAFNEAIKAAAPQLIRLNVYVFLMLNAEPAVHLNAVKRAWKLAGRGKILKFAQILKLHEMLGYSDFTADELECILISLIGRGWIKGHLGHDSQAMVLSPIDPFPLQQQ